VTKYLRSFVNRRTLGQIVRVGLIGGFNTLVYYLIFNLLLLPLDWFWSVTVAFALATGLSYVLNRRWSFQIADGSVGNARETTKFFLVNLAAWGVTVVVLMAADLMFGPLSRTQANLASILATGLIILPKFAAYRDVVFRRSLDSMDATTGSLVGEQPALEQS